jgi:hypothetical protein
MSLDEILEELEADPPLEVNAGHPNANLQTDPEWDDLVADWIIDDEPDQTDHVAASSSGIPQSEPNPRTPERPRKKQKTVTPSTSATDSRRSPE